jgi:hypothetical protein
MTGRKRQVSPQACEPGAGQGRVQVGVRPLMPALAAAGVEDR